MFRTPNIELRCEFHQYLNVSREYQSSREKVLVYALFLHSKNFFAAMQSNFCLWRLKKNSTASIIVAMNFLLHFLILFTSPVFAFAVVESVPHLTIRYNARPPFIFEEGGKVQGEVATLALKIIEESGVPFEVVHTPVNRQLMLIYAGQGYDCSMGWFRTPEREKNAKFTDATYEDGPWVAIGHKGTMDPNLTNVRELLQNRKLRYLYQERFSNGPVLDQLISDLKPTGVLMEGDIEKMLIMVKTGRADYFFLSDIEFKHMLEKTKTQRSDYVIPKLADLPTNPKRHIMCSKKVPDFVIERLNKAIQKVRGKI